MKYLYMLYFPNLLFAVLCNSLALTFVYCRYISSIAKLITLSHYTVSEIIFYYTLI